MRTLVLGIMAAALAIAGGDDVFAKRCAGCHALDRDKEGPRLGGVCGRPAGAVAKFNYSAALLASKIKWDRQTLDRWLADPDKLVPGTDMEFHVESPDERSAIIDFLCAGSRSGRRQK